MLLPDVGNHAHPASANIASFPHRKPPLLQHVMPLLRHIHGVFSLADPLLPGVLTLRQMNGDPLSLSLLLDNALHSCVQSVHSLLNFFIESLHFLAFVRIIASLDEATALDQFGNVLLRKP